MAFPEPIKPLGQKEADDFLKQREGFHLSKPRREHFLRLRTEAQAGHD